MDDVIVYPYGLSNKNIQLYHNIDLNSHINFGGTVIINDANLDPPNYFPNKTNICNEPPLPLKTSTKKSPYYHLNLSFLKSNVVFKFSPTIKSNEIKQITCGKMMFIMPFETHNKITSLMFDKDISKLHINYENNVSIHLSPFIKKSNTYINLCKLDEIDNITNISLIKIDVENMELDVLEGAIELIKRFKPTILIEIHYYDKFIASDIFKQIQTLGYKIEQTSESISDYILYIDII